MNTIEQVLQLFEDSIDVLQPYLKTNLEENSEIEFKNSLHTKSETIDKQYLKTISGFANNNGGTIIFGVSPDKHEIVGIKEEYENLDNRYVSSTISNGLDGAFRFHFITKRFLSKVVGFLIVEKADTKPVIMKIDSSDFKLGEIYFRYPAQTSKIMAHDLRKIIADEIASGIAKAIGNLNKLLQMGDNAAILDTQSGIIDSGEKLPKFILDERILKNLNLIKVGEFVEKDGSPAYIIKGEIETGNLEVIEKTVLSNLYESDIIGYFTKSKCENPKLVMEKLLTLPSPYFPMHFFIKEADLTLEEALKFIDSLDIKPINTKNITKIKERIADNYNYKTSVIFEDMEDELRNGKYNQEYMTELAKKYSKPKTMHLKLVRTIILNSIKKYQKIDTEVFENYNQAISEAITHVDPELIIKTPEYFLNLIEQLYKHEKSNHTSFKKAICYVDDVLFNQKRTATLNPIVNYSKAV